MMSWLVEALVASTILMLVVLVLRAPVRKAFGADIAYALWALPVLRLMLPPLPAEWHEAAVAPVLRAAEPVTILFVEPMAETAAAPGLPWLVPGVILLWVAGAAAFIVWHGLAHRRFCRRMLDEAASNAELDGVHVIETDAASGPLAFGIWRRYVAFPRDFAERYEPEERDLALAHELGHHARGDLIANWVALVVLALHWFNPIAWRAFRAFRADQEIANDARVLRGMNPMRRHTYACAIVKAAHGGAVSAACHLHTIDDLKGRLRMLTTNKTSRARLFAGTGTLAVLVTAGLGLTASGTAAAARVRTSVERATGMSLASLDQAVPAVATVRSVAEAEPAPVTPVAPVTEPPAPSSAVPVYVEPPVPSVPVTGENGVTTTILPDGKVVRKRVTVIVRKDGKVVSRDSREVGATPMVPDMPPIPEMARIPEMPQISSADCKPDGKDGEMVKHFENAGKKIIIICSNHIRAAAERGAAMAANGKDMERHAYARALDGLRTARARMLDSKDMAAEARQHALEGIDTAIKEIEGDLARAQ